MKASLSLTLPVSPTPRLASWIAVPPQPTEVNKALTASTLIGAQRISISAHFTRGPLDNRPAKHSVLLVEDVPDLLEDAAVAGLPHFLAGGGGELMQCLALPLIQPRRGGNAHDHVLVAADRASH